MALDTFVVEVFLLCSAVLLTNFFAIYMHSFRQTLYSFAAKVLNFQRAHFEMLSLDWKLRNVKRDFDDWVYD